MYTTTENTVIRNRYFVTNATSQSQSIFGSNHKWEVANLLQKRPEKQRSYFFKRFINLVIFTELVHLTKHVTILLLE